MEEQRNNHRFFSLSATFDWSKTTKSSLSSSSPVPSVPEEAPCTCVLTKTRLDDQSCIRFVKRFVSQSSHKHRCDVKRTQEWSMKSILIRIGVSRNKKDSGQQKAAQKSDNINQTPAWASLIEKVSAKVSFDSALYSLLQMGSVPSTVIAQSIQNSATTGVLVLTNRGLSEIPAQVFDYTSSMRILDLSANHIFRLPAPDIEAFVNLKSLFLNQNRMLKLPESIGCLEKLECLSVSYNFLETLPDSLIRLKNLREVKLAANRFHRFPDPLAGLPNLELLDLSANLIEDLHTDRVDLGSLMVSSHGNFFPLLTLQALIAFVMKEKCIAQRFPLKSIDHCFRPST